MNPNIEHSNRRKVLFVGYGRAGKDEAAQFAEAHVGLRYGGSFSWHAKEDVAKFMGVHPMTAWETRHANRRVWYEQCNVIRENNITELAERALATGDICAGLRDQPELFAVVEKDLFDLIVWIERPGTPVDPTVTFTKDDVLNAGGFVIVNDGTLEDYHFKLLQFFFAHRMAEPNRLSLYAQNLIRERGHIGARV